MRTKTGIKLGMVLVLLGTLPHPCRADIGEELNKVFKGKAVEIEVTNNTRKPVYAWVDDTGRHGDKVKPDKVNGADGKALPPGLVVAPGATRTFGECVGVGDVPTIHFVPLTNPTTAATRGKSDKKVGPDDYGKQMIKLKRPVIRLVVTDEGIKLAD
jgi:hypothetical protein